ncbi:SDR family NAD(P)-dependent oxidoreductase [Smaragdicoccus niigatensis]|uniref:SDR family NAD(P)-dependent oxidoreductase n=1 Tax=Smaragdicoccus niigatensis TaxID=359359 RepID=UPI0003820075|nr:SDR family NAD(P)-dependent oxidoreductase [Smaragdicoccus niigatensis]
MTVVAITGGGRGIGRAIAERLAADGMRVAIGDVDVASARTAATEIEGAVGHHVDVSDAASFERFIDEVEASLGPIDILVNNAGIMPIGPFLEHDVALAQRAVNINLHGPLNGMRAVLPRMKARGGGHIVNVASTAGVRGVPGGVVYSATKFAVVGMSEAVRQEFAADNVTVTTVLPSFTNTELIAGTKGLKGVPTVEPADVANAVANAIARKHATVFVPGYLEPLAALQRLVPGFVLEFLTKLTGADRVFLDVDHKGRTSYDKRIAG